LIRGLFSRPGEWRVPADKGLAALVFEIDLRLSEWCVKQVVGVMLDAGSRRWANGQPIQPQGIAAGDPVVGVERQELGQRLFLAAIEHVALILGDDQG